MDFETYPDIVLLVQKDTYWINTAAHIITVLRCPQVQLVIEGSEIPTSAHTVIKIGPSNWNVDLKNSDVWSLDRGLNIDSNPNANTEYEKYSKLPTRRDIDIVELTTGVHASETSKLENAFFWICERLQKGYTHLGRSEYEEWCLSLKILELKTNRNDRLLEFLQENIHRRQPNTQNHKNKLLKKFLSQINIAKCINYRKVNKKGIFKNKASLIQYAMTLGKQDKHKFNALLQEFCETSPNSYWLVAIGIASYYSEDKFLFQRVYKTLSNDKWYSQNIAIPLILPNSNRFCYSPLVIAWRYLVLKNFDNKYQIPIGIGREKRVSKTIDWKPTFNRKFFDPQKKLISFSLLLNWQKLHQADEFNKQQIKLTKINYANTIYPLESIWFDIFKHIQHSKNKIAIRLSPWPFNKKAAFSIRYDVDRPINENVVSKIVAIQKKYLNAYCGSWFYFKEDFFKNRTDRLSGLKQQEIGIHLRIASEAMRNYGCTFHSAPNSEYWRGKSTIETLVDKQVDYMEFMSFQTLYPRPAYIDHDTNSGSLPWVLPIHFPLEGSTNDSDLSYFDNLRSEFRNLLQCGGHAIIGSHPDLNQNLLIDLIRREELKNVWFNTIGNVVKRCRDIMSYGNIQLIESSKDRIFLRSKKYIKDLQVESWTPDDRKKSFCAQQVENRENLFIYQIAT